LCSDDKHPDDLLLGHVNELVIRALAKGHQLMDVLQCACINPVKHYGLKVGLLRENDPADFIVTDDPARMNVQQTYINGELVAEKGKSFLPPKQHSLLNNFNCSSKKPEDFEIPANGK